LTLILKNCNQFVVRFFYVF